jgi:signal transduction histidine kinase
MGMGLAVVDTLVKQMGGSVSVQSEAGVFTEVTIRFPSAENSV